MLLGFQIAVRDPARVGEREALGHLSDHRQFLIERQILIRLA